MYRFRLWHSCFAIVVCCSVLSTTITLAAETKVNPRAHERWIWTELLAFDNQQPDLGVEQYLNKTGFAPQAICLLIGSPDFVLSHPGIKSESKLAIEYCSRDGHEFNQERSRQDWTNHQLRSLISELQKRKVQVYLSIFTAYLRVNTHREWIADHLEVLSVRKSSGFVWRLNCLSRLNDGSYFEDYLAQKMVETLTDYGFDGWHGADGWGPLSAPLHKSSFADDMIDQFATSSGLELPKVVTQKCFFEVPKLEARAAWILKHKRAEWSEFYAQRWTRFWTTMVDTLHKAEKKAVINSSWGRAPFEAYYRYGIDYQRIAKTGVDGIIVETVAVGLATDPRTADSDRHDEFLSMMLLMRACVPETRLIFLHGVHDVVEQWDAIHHAPMILEREIYTLNNIFHTIPNGSLIPSVSGFLVCLGDALKRSEWSWLEERWQLAYSALPVKTHGPSVVWSDAAYIAQTEDYLDTHTWNSHRILFELMMAGATIQNTININDIEHAQGTLLIPNPHLFPTIELEKVKHYKNGPVILVGRKPNSFSQPNVEFNDFYAPNELWCGIYNANPTIASFAKEGEEGSIEELLKQEDPSGFWDYIPYRKVSSGFVKTCANTIQALSTPITVVKENESVDLMPVDLANGRTRIAIKNRTFSYARPTIDFGQPIEEVKVLSNFPSVLIEPKDSRFSIRVPGRGITVVEVIPKTQN